MKKIYFSGIDRLKHLQLLHSENAAVMVSPPKTAIKKDIRKFLESNSVDSFLDSGIFSAPISIEEYLDVIQEVGHLFEWIANLDKIDDQQSSNKNFDFLINKLSSELNKKIVWIYQNGSVEELKEFARSREMIAVGGLVPLRQSPSKIKTRLIDVSSALKEIPAKVHIFGVTNPTLLIWASFQSCFYSADSTRWLYGMKSGELLTMSGKSFDSIEYGLSFTPEERTRHNIRILKSFTEEKSSLQLSLLDEVA